MSERPTYASMGEVRAAIDALDEQLMPLMAARAHCIAEAARIKGDPETALVPWRVDEVAAHARELATRQGMDADLAEKLWRAMMAEFIAHERRLMEQAAGN
ncbi:chorismate mutase [Chelatococcus sambhunathii]|uniref:chorismate mutase n=1 Tax=Chelatococcus sambhunathii TaxID=363953 RepID=UPI0028528B90|nr:chorismate mutase [Chelatococcus sambhunathii]